eukprot:m.48235 g.48235  ORF g.48235 m.48235 type:complete len:248 (-) comp13276_c0_seq7:577-1320(-)
MAKRLVLLVLCSISNFVACINDPASNVQDILPKLLAKTQTHALTARPYLLLTVINNAYRDVGFNGLVAMARFGVTPVWLCGDEQVVSWLSKANVDCIFLPWGRQHGLGSLWYLRMLLAREILKHDVDVLLVDSDAVWLQDAMGSIHAELSPPNKAHVIAQRGSFPHTGLGAALCCGFLYLKADAETVKLLERVAPPSAPSGFDDQALVPDCLPHDMLTGQMCIASFERGCNRPRRSIWETDSVAYTT